MPACRHAPPNRILSRRASRIELAGAADQRADRRAEPLRHAEHHRVDLARVLRHVDACRDGRVEDPRAVEVDGKVVVVGHLPDGPDLLDGHDRAAGVAHRVLDREQVDDLDVVVDRPARGARAARAAVIHARAGRDRAVRNAMPDRTADVMTSVRGDMRARRRAPRGDPARARAAAGRSGWPSCRSAT